MLSTILGLIYRLFLLGLLGVAALWAYDIRLYAIKNYGRLIHEFDPWFNYRATEYLLENGVQKFFKWFDHRAWYPLGRPVGTTIYPGMQLTSVAIYHALQYLGIPMSLNDICVFVPTWFGAIASVITGLLAAECSGMITAAPLAALVMAIIPAHTMRSVGGGYDNESIAVSAMVLTFYLWNRAVRTPRSWPWAVLAGLAHVYMAAAWGGYVFVINTVGAHAALLVLLRRFDFSIYKAYTIFYIVGTVGAMQVPVVSWTPLKSMEQVGPLGIFAFYQILGLIEVLRRQRGYAKGSREAQELRNQVLMIAGGAVGLVLSVLMQTGYFGPLSARVRGLFLKHMRTGNPLVDSVAEHQPTSKDAYWQYLHYACYFSPLGWLTLFAKPTNSKIFLIMYSMFGYFFASRMNRLLILMGPIASATTGVALAALLHWCWEQRNALSAPKPEAEADGAAADAGADATKDAATKDTKTKAKPPKKDKGQRADSLTAAWLRTKERAISTYNSTPVRQARVAMALIILVSLPVTIPLVGGPFYEHAHWSAQGMSSPSIVYKVTSRSGERITVTDYLDSYIWLRENTPEDARVLSWWDYGYQISGIANRTTLADGNTWDLEHISLIARCLTSKEKKAHRLVRHLADYVLVWSGGGGDDLAKSPHIARIGNSVYPDICPNDPMCYSFGFTDNRQTPTPTMANSLLYKLTMNGVAKGVTVDEELFKEVYTSKYGLVRIYKVRKVSKKSKQWVLENRVCDAPGSWYCPGQYPPAVPVKKGQGHATLDYDKHGHAYSH